MSNNNAWMPLYIGDYLGDTMELTGAQHGAYLLLLMYYWRNGPLPADDARLASIARTERRIWDRDVWPVVKGFFRLGDDGRLHQKRADMELAKASDAGDRAREDREAATDRMRRWRASRNGGHPPPDGDGGDASQERHETVTNTERDGERDVSLPHTPSLSSHSPSQKPTPTPPTGWEGTQRVTGGGRREEATNPRALGTNPRAMGTNPRKPQYRCGFHEVAQAETPRPVTITATAEDAEQSVVYLDQILGRTSNG